MPVKSQYAIDNPTTAKVLERGYTPVIVWIGGWYGGWRVEAGSKWQQVYVLSERKLKKFPINSKEVKEIKQKELDKEVKQFILI